MPTPLIEITGFPQLIRQIQSLETDRQRLSETRKILRRVAMGTVRVARSEAPIAKRAHVARRERIQPGNLRKSIGVIAGKSRENAVVYAGPRVKRGQKGWYGHFVELGHNIYRAGFRRDRSGGTRLSRAQRRNAAGVTGRTRANAYMARAYDSTKGQVTEETLRSVTAYIQRRIDALSRA